MSLSPRDSVTAVFDLFRAHGTSDYVGEAVSQESHALQAGALASAAGHPPAVVAGCLLHDVGHMLGLRFPDRYGRMGDCGVMAHEGIGAAWLESLGFPATTAALVRRHVDAKRYRCFKDPSYRGRLSEASKVTLGYQGGPMGAEEAAAFEADPLGPLILQMRDFDEAAKVPGLAVPDLESYRPLLEGLVAAKA
jgi:predicted HD phosphohydrolase